MRPFELRVLQICQPGHDAQSMGLYAINYIIYGHA
jgi:hypothetical protein